MGDNQQSLNQLLQWGIENSAASRDNQSNERPHDPQKGLDGKMLAELLGGPSDADRMREAMSAILAPLEQVDLENKLTAFDNLEQLIEHIDNANNMESLGLWTPLLSQLDNEQSELRLMAAWCCSTAVQNNVKSQERLLAHGGVEKLAKVATGDAVQSVRKKAISALSSEVRNFQPGLDKLEESLPNAVWTKKKTASDAGDMEAVDEVIQALRNHAASS